MAPIVWGMLDVPSGVKDKLLYLYPHLIPVRRMKNDFGSFWWDIRKLDADF